MMKTKICGITNLRDAKFAIEFGAWALGFNFYKASPRFLEIEQAREIIKNLPKEIVKVGLFVDQDYATVNHIMKDLQLDLAQVYQNYDCPIQEKKSMIFVIQPIQGEDLPSLKVLKEYGYILIDAPRGKNDVYGGSGKLANWELASELSKEVKLILAGGLNSENIGKATAKVNPWGVDVCSSVESSPGIKDPILLKEFLDRSLSA